MSELPMLEAALLDAARRRYRRPRWPFAVPRLAKRTALVAAAAAVVIVALTLFTRADDVGVDERPAASPPTWTTTVDHKRGFEVSIPTGWQLAGESLTPELTDPRELLSAGTFPLRFRESDCSHVPTGALSTMGPTDGFVTVLERGRDPRSAWTEFAPRPADFSEKARPERGDVAGCLRDGSRLAEFWMPFTDEGRHFYAIVVLGPDVPSDIRAQAFEILDRMRFDPAVRPDWSATG